MLAEKLHAILRSRGVVVDDPMAFIVVARADGSERLGTWDEVRLGARPTPAEIAAVTEVQAATEAKRRLRERDLDDLKVRALARAIHLRLARPDAATMSVATWRAILEQAWDTEKS